MEHLLSTTPSKRVTSINGCPHTFAMILINNGQNVNNIAERLGIAQQCCLILRTCNESVRGAINRSV